MDRYSIKVIAAEFEHQLELWGPEHDAHHVEKELAKAAIAYLKLYVSETLGDRELAKSIWPWDTHWNPKTPRDVLIKAGAFIASELERINVPSEI